MKKLNRMKKLKKIIKWMILSILLQAVALTYANFIYLPGRGAVKATMYEVKQDEVTGKKLRLPEDAEGITVSYNGHLAAYRQGDSLIIKDLKSKKNVQTIDVQDGKFGYYRWLPDRDMIIYSVKEPDDEAGQVQILTYDVGPGLERSYPKITGLPKESEVVDIELSPLTNVVYAKIKTSETRARIYKYNIMDELSYIMNTAVDIVLKETSFSDNLAYQDASKIIVRNGKSGSKKTLSLKGTNILLSIDSEDKIYVGKLNEEELVTTVIHGKTDEQIKEWQISVLDTAVSPSDIFITPDGSLYRASRQENLVYSISDNKSVSYEGILLEILEYYIVSKNEDMLFLTPIK